MKEYKVKVWPNGSKYWYLNGELHNEAGPAIEYANGSKFWFLNGEEFTEEAYNDALNCKQIKINHIEITDELIEELREELRDLKKTVTSMSKQIETLHHPKDDLKSFKFKRAAARFQTQQARNLNPLPFPRSMITKKYITEKERARLQQFIDADDARKDCIVTGIGLPSVKPGECAQMAKKIFELIEELEKG